MKLLISVSLVVLLLSSTVDSFGFDLGCGCAPPPPPPCLPPPPPPLPPLPPLPNFAVCPPLPICPILPPPTPPPPPPPPPPQIASPCTPGLFSFPQLPSLFAPPRYAATAGQYATAPVQSPAPPPPMSPQHQPPVQGYSVAAHPAFLFIQPDQPQQSPPMVMSSAPVMGDTPAPMSNTSRTRFRLAAAAARAAKTQQDGNVVVTENCSNEQLRQLIVDNNDGIMTSTKQIIQAIAETKFGGRFDVFCSKGDFSYTANTQLYCQAERNGFSCLAYQQLS